MSSPRTKKLSNDKLKTNILKGLAISIPVAGAVAAYNYMKRNQKFDRLALERKSEQELKIINDTIKKQIQECEATVIAKEMQNKFKQQFGGKLFNIFTAVDKESLVESILFNQETLDSCKKKLAQL